ncbi:MAG: ATP-binding protein [Deltaproteobacteria bacterium]|nr:ATP-binding protein [Deltaproteobacteria bacterium]
MSKRCPRCGDTGYRTVAEGRFAEGRVCRHLQACPRCHGEGTLLQRDARGYEVITPCSCELLSVARRVGFYDRARIPARFANSRIDAYEARDPHGTQHRARQLMTQLAGNFRRGDRGLGLGGAPGVGKTHLLTALCGYFALERGFEVRYADFADLIGELRARFEQGGGAEALVGTVVDAPVLFIDELGKGRATEWEQSIVDAIISRRYGRGLSLFFATNFAFADDDPNREPLAGRIGERAMSRLREMCRLEWISGPDGRAMAAAHHVEPVQAKKGPRGMSRIS